MAETFAGIIEEIDRFSIPSRMEKFLVRERPPSTADQTLGFYAYGYERAFDIIATVFKQKWRNGDYLQFPLFYLARHSIELSLKNAIEDFASYTGDPSADLGHNLSRLWIELNRQFRLAGMPEEDSWGVHCAKLIGHIHEIDPTGEAFRYPHNMQGRTFAYTRVSFDGLVKAHNHLTGYCSASIDMLSEYRNY
ncbi:MAG TPA: hypothetical protein VKD19_08385 [Pseudolabrys sp.]|nr:hypothetical protein [Pseudolabrys sp.]